MTIQRLAAHLADEADAARRWLLLLEFLEEYEHEPAHRRQSLVDAEPATIGDAHWDPLRGLTDPQRPLSQILDTSLSRRASRKGHP